MMKTFCSQHVNFVLMNDKRAYSRYTWFILVFVFLVILAGGVVRMTQSGMGCPDWPRCFGSWIPPTDASQLPPDFEKYLKQQDIDHTFNAYHTWIEYINRLLGALLGFFIIGHVIWSVRKFRKTNTQIVFLSVLMLIATGFQGWLGKKVVDGNLEVVKVTIHMLVALVIAALPVLILHKLKKSELIADKKLRMMANITIVFIIGQIILGTEVREQIDGIARSLKYAQRDLWIERLDQFFFLHRSFSWLVLVGVIALFAWSREHYSLRTRAGLALFFTIFSVALGLLMYGFNMPAIAQPLHLLSASALAITLFSFRLHLK